ncbi:fatty-acid amide hydrolase 2-B [Eucyclogobius newberryi]|uniref:fatty-acid amide hydrolase 2-B n=1 Tax=Eucyclogobius newberryi TaxID=166745 RepID=UPI003B5C7582
MARNLMETIHNAVMAALFWLVCLLTPKSPVSGKKLPPVRQPLLLEPATQLARKIRRREVCSVEVVQAYIDRIQEVNPLINAMIQDRFSLALQEAAQVDKLIEEETGGEGVLEDRLPLLGVPLSVKESFALHGMAQTAGAVSKKGKLATVDAPVVALLKRAGAIPLGVTNVPEQCMWIESHNHLYGMTRNPYNLDRISGGSSGGEGSILGGACSVIGVGSDIGGSIRLPSFFCGIFGHKPTPGIVSNENQLPPISGPQEELLGSGPMCRYAVDLLPMLKIMAGANVDKLSLNKKVEMKKLRFFTLPDCGEVPLTHPVSEDLQRAQKKVVERLEADLGVKVEEVHFPEFKHTMDMWFACMSLPTHEGKAPPSLAELLGEPGSPVWPLWELLKAAVGKSDHTMPAILFALKSKATTPQFSALKIREKLQQDFAELLGTDGVLLHPSFARVAPKHHHPLFTFGDIIYTAIYNVLGLPVTQCPLGLNEQGLPLGVQVVAGKLQDHLTIETAVYLEKAFGGWRDPGAN